MWRMWLAALMWGLNWPAVKILLTSSSPWALRTAGLAYGAAVLAFITGVTRTSFAIPRGAWRHMVVAGLLNVAGFNIFAVFAQLSMPTSRAAILTFTMPFWATLFGWIFLREPIDRLRAASLGVGACGLTILSSSFWPELAAGRLPFGLVYVLGAAISWAAGTVYLKKFKIAAEPLALTTWQLIIATAACAIGMLLFETPRLDLSEPRLMAAFTFHVVFPQAIAYLLWFGLIRRVSSSTATLGLLLVPVFGVIGAVIILGDRPTALDLFGFALLFLAVQADQLLRSDGGQGGPR
jgi:drug/metabolite transporter (DMT)-like permease